MLEQLVEFSVRRRGVVLVVWTLRTRPPLRVTVSPGIVVVPKAGITTELDLVNAADRALYLAKRNGRNRSVVFGDESSML